MAPHCEGPDPAALIRHRYIAIKRTVPDRLDWITGSPTDCLDLVARFRLEEALEPNVTPSRHPVQEMRCPVSRVQPSLHAKSHRSARNAADHDFERVDLRKRPRGGTAFPSHLDRYPTRRSASNHGRTSASRPAGTWRPQPRHPLAQHQ
jgi:hypothetical protein